MNEIQRDVSEAVEKAADEAAKVTKAELRSTSPTNKGDYKKGWAIKKVRKQKSVIVYNAKFPGLTHLLEKGHVIRNGKGEYGRAPAHPHMGKAADKGADVFLKETMDDLDKQL